MFFRCSVCRSILEMFAIVKSKVVRNRADIWTSLALPNSTGEPSKNCTHIYHPSLAARDLEKFREGTHTSREVIRAHTLNFRPNFKFSRLKFLWGRNIVSRKMSTWVGQYRPLELFCLWSKVHLISFVQRGRGCGWSSFFRCSICRSVPEIGLFNSQSKSKVVRNGAEIWTFFGPPKFYGAGLPKIVRRLSPLPHGT